MHRYATPLWHEMLAFAGGRDNGKKKPWQRNGAATKAGNGNEVTKNRRIDVTN